MTGLPSGSLDSGVVEKFRQLHASFFGLETESKKESINPKTKHSLFGIIIVATNRFHKWLVFNVLN